jgi:peptide/nickel transport system ATP-binding protein
MPGEVGEALLEVRHLSVSFRSAAGVVRAVEDVSFSLGSREILAIVGESGSGKSLTCLAILRLVTDPAAIVEGSIRFRGREVPALGTRELRQLRGGEIAMIFQDPMTAMTPVQTIGWQIAEQLHAHLGLSAKAARARVVELLGQMGIPRPEEAARRYPHQLSGGMRQRAMIAMALSCDPALLIADEPTTALDVTIQAQILELLQRLCRDRSSSIILVTHDLGVVATVADRVMVMYAGGLAERGPASAVLERPSHPYTLGLLDSIPPLDGPRPFRLPAIPGGPPSPSARPAGCLFQPRCAFRFEACAERPPVHRLGDQESACHLAARGRPDWGQAA